MEIFHQEWTHRDRKGVLQAMWDICEDCNALFRSHLFSEVANKFQPHWIMFEDSDILSKLMDRPHTVILKTKPQTQDHILIENGRGGTITGVAGFTVASYSHGDEVKTMNSDFDKSDDFTSNPSTHVSPKASDRDSEEVSSFLSPTGMPPVNCTTTSINRRLPELLPLYLPEHAAATQGSSFGSSTVADSQSQVNGSLTTNTVRGRLDSIDADVNALHRLIELKHTETACFDAQVQGLQLQADNIQKHINEHERKKRILIDRKADFHAQISSKEAERATVNEELNKSKEKCEQWTKKLDAIHRLLFDDIEE